MADTYAAKPEGFKGFYPRRPIGIHDSIMPLTREKLSSSTRDVWKGVPVISAANDTFDRVAVQGTDEVQTITITGTPTGGSFTITSTISGYRPSGASYTTFTGTTAAIAYNATAATVQTALEAILGVGNVTCAGGPFPGTAVTVTFKGLLSATNVAQLSTTDSLTGGSTPASAVTTTTAGVLGKVTSTVLLGFSEEWDAGTIPHWTRNWGQAPINLEGPFATTTKKYLIYPDLSGSVYTANIWPTELVAASLVGTTYSLGWNNTTGQVYVRTGDTSTALVTVVGIPDGQIGKLGGLVDFVVADGASVFH